jgi:AraC-like DNA-binding protein
MAAHATSTLVPAPLGEHQTTSPLVLRWLLSHARRAGLDLAWLYRELGIAPSALANTEARLPATTVQRIWSRLAVASGDEAFGLHLAERSDDDDFEILDYLVYFSSTVREALARIARFYRLVADDTAIRIVQDGDVARVVRVFCGTMAEQQDAYFALVCMRLRSATQRRLVPREVRFEHPPLARRELAAFFGCPIRYGCDFSELIFASADLDLPIHAAKPRLAGLLERYAAELLARLPASASYPDHVRRAIASVIRCGQPTLQAIAREMHASPRTVQRRLSDAGTTHKRLVEDVRRQLATRYIESPRLSITEIAFLLGYQEESSFRRAFKKWTGKSPRRARAADLHAVR